MGAAACCCAWPLLLPRLPSPPAPSHALASGERSPPISPDLPRSPRALGSGERGGARARLGAARHPHRDGRGRWLAPAPRGRDHHGQADLRKASARRRAGAAARALRAVGHRRRRRGARTDLPRSPPISPQWDTDGDGAVRPARSQPSASCLLALDLARISLHLDASRCISADAARAPTCSISHHLARISLPLRLHLAR